MKADIMFLVDSSGSIGLENFIKMKTFMKNLVSKSQIRADRVQIGVVQFSDVNKEEFQLNRYTSQEEISDAIDRMAHIGETTLMGSALTFVSQYFSPAKGVASVVSDSMRPHRQQPTRLHHPWDSPGKNTGVGCHFLLQCMKVKSES